MADAIGKVAGVVDVNDGIVLAGDALDIDVDREQAALEGMEPDAVTQDARRLSDRARSPPKSSGPEDGRRARLDSQRDDRKTAMTSTTCAARARRPPVPAQPRRPASTRSPASPQINRDNLKRMVAVTGRISGRDMGSTDPRRQAAARPARAAPARRLLRLGGLYQQQQIAFRGLMIVFAAAVRAGLPAAAVPLRELPRGASPCCTTLLAVGGGVRRPLAHGHGAEHHRA